MAESARGQDEESPVFWFVSDLATQKGKMDPSCALPYNKSFIDQAKFVTRVLPA